MSKKIKQTISIPQGTSLYVGAVLGSGILILPGITAGIAGTSAIISWIIMVLLSIPLACTFAFLSIDYPSAGGISTFAEEAFGRYVGSLSGWLFFIAGSFGQILVSLTGGVYISFAFHLPKIAAYAIALVLLLIATIGNYYGIKTSGKVQLITASLTFLILLGTIVLSLPHIQYGHINLELNKNNIVPIGQSAMLIFWSMFGWEAISSLAPEFKDPKKKNIMGSTLGAIVVIGILYIGIALAVIGTHSYSPGSSSSASQSLNNASLAEVVRKVAGLNGAWVTGIVAFTICLGTNNAFIAGISRLGYSLAHSKVAPKWLDYLDGNSVPRRSVLFVGIFSVLGLAVSYIFNIGLDKLVFVPNSLAIATYVIGTAAGVKLIKHVFGKIAAFISCILCLAAYPFIGASIIIPLVVIISCLLYMRLRDKKEKSAKS